MGAAQGELHAADGTRRTVAAKCLSATPASSNDASQEMTTVAGEAQATKRAAKAALNLLKEAEALQHIKHEHVVRAPPKCTPHINNREAQLANGL